MAKTKPAKWQDTRAGRGEQSPAPLASTEPRIRIDKWLWQARFFKSRSLATALVETGHVRINGQPVGRASREVGAGDVLTFPQGNYIRLVKIVGTGVRRGPAPEAQSLYIDLDAPADMPDMLE